MDMNDIKKMEDRLSVVKAAQDAFLEIQESGGTSAKEATLNFGTAKVTVEYAPRKAD